MREQIDSCHKESKSCATYPEHSTAHLNNIAKITLDSDIITPQKKQNRIKKNIHKDNDTPLEKNGANKSIIARKTIGPNAIKTIEQIARNIIEM